MKIMIMLISALFVSTTLAAPKKFPKWSYTPSSAMPAGEPFQFTLEDHNSVMKMAEKDPVRKIAGDPVDDGSMSQALKDIRDELNALGFDKKGNKLSKEKLYDEATKFDAILAKMEKEAPNQASDYKFVAAHLVPIRALKSFTYRMIPVVQDAQALRQTLVEAIQTTYSDLKIYFPNNEWEVGFVYLTEPMEGMAPQFRNDQEVQDFFATEFANIIKNFSIPLVAGISLAPGKALVFDNRFIYGKLSFPQKDMERFIWIRSPEILGALSRFHRQLYGIHMASIYNANKSAFFSKELAALYGVEVMKAEIANKFIRTDVMAPSRNDRVKLINDPAFSNSFVKNPKADNHIQQGIYHLKASVSYSYGSWMTLRNLPDNQKNVFLDSGFVKGRAEETEKAFRNMYEILYNDKKTVTSVVTGKTIEVDLLGFLTQHLPNDSKQLLPTGFDSSPSWMTRKIGNKDIRYRNYASERAIAWDSEIYGNLFPELKKMKKEQADKMVPEMMRTLTESRGGAILAEFIYPYVR